MDSRFDKRRCCVCGGVPLIPEAGKPEPGSGGCQPCYHNEVCVGTGGYYCHHPQVIAERPDLLERQIRYAQTRDGQRMPWCPAEKAERNNDNDMISRAEAIAVLERLAKRSQKVLGLLNHGTPEYEAEMGYLTGLIRARTAVAASRAVAAQRYAEQSPRAAEPTIARIAYVEYLSPIGGGGRRMKTIMTREEKSVWFVQYRFPHWPVDEWHDDEVYQTERDAVRRRIDLDCEWQGRTDRAVHRIKQYKALPVEAGE